MAYANAIKCNNIEAEVDEKKVEVKKITPQDIPANVRHYMQNS